MIAGDARLQLLELLLLVILELVWLMSSSGGGPTEVLPQLGDDHGLRHDLRLGELHLLQRLA